MLVFEAMHSLHHRLFARILEIVRGGEIGAMCGIEASFSVPIPEWARRLAGEDFTVPSATAVFRNGVDASFAARLDCAGGVTCEVASSMIASTVSSRLVVRGDGGTLSVRNPLAPQSGHSLTLINSAGERVETVDGPSSY